MNIDKINIDRRKFLKFLGLGAMATTVPSCVSTEDTSNDELNGDVARQIKGKMTYRTNPKTKDQISLLGYGCMRFTQKAGKTDLDLVTFLSIRL